MNYDLILFDLDGTLSDSGPGIMQSVKYALAKFGIAEENETVLRAFVGPPLLASFNRFYGFDREKGWKALEYYREDYVQSGIYNNVPYPGIEELLTELKKKGLKTAVATGKPVPMAEEVLRYFGWSALFDMVGGATMDESRVEKNDIIRYVLDSLGITDLSRVLMVGDRNNDILGAKALGIPSCGVTYGYGPREELTGAGADYIIDTPAELLRLL